MLFWRHHESALSSSGSKCTRLVPASVFHCMAPMVPGAEPQASPTHPPNSILLSTDSLGAKLLTSGSSASLASADECSTHCILAFFPISFRVSAAGKPSTGGISAAVGSSYE